MALDGGFWLFVAVLVAAVTWRKASARRDAHATIRMAIEKGQPLDPALIDRLLPPAPNEHGLLVAGAVLLAVGIGLPLMGYVIGLSEAGPMVLRVPGADGPVIGLGAGGRVFLPLLGAGIPVLLMGGAFVLLWRFLRRKQTTSERDRPA